MIHRRRPGMGDAASDLASLQAQMAQLVQKQCQLVTQNQNLTQAEQALSTVNPTVGAQSADLMKSHLAAILPPQLMPGNVGRLEDNVWDFFSPITIDFGANPSWDSNSRNSASFQVTQEAGMLVTQVAMYTASAFTCGLKAPLVMQIQDNQSTRQLQSNPVPIQVMGRRGIPFKFPFPYLFMPNASIQVTLSSFMDPGEAPQLTLGSGLFQFLFYGVKVRVEDQLNVLSSAFSY